MSQTPTMLLKRWMLFVDGENFAINGRKFLAQRGVDLSDVEHPAYIRDVFLWFPNAPGNHRIAGMDVSFEARCVRSYFYTSTPGDQQARASAIEKIWTTKFHPEVFHRKRDGRSKGVDIALARDLLVHAFEGHLETAILIAGDADYIPLVREVKRRGRQILLAFFAESPALSAELRLECDGFLDLSAPLATEWANVPRTRR